MCVNLDIITMLPENESSIQPEDQLENVDQLESSATPVEETQIPVEEPTLEASASEEEVETAAETIVSEEPVVQEQDEPIVTEAVVESPAEKTETEVADTTEETDDAEAPEAEPSLVPVPEISDELIQQINGILGEENSTDLLTAASAVELVHAIDHFALAEDVLKHVARVGLIKRSFDALRSESELPDELVDAFRVSLGNFNRKRSDSQRKGDQVKLENSQKKKELLEKLREIVDTDDATKIQEVRAIQDEWKTIGHVVKDDIEPLYKNYRYLLDKFYKLREMHFELLDYDRKINLQEKERLIEEAVSLIPDEESRTDPEVWREKMDLLTELQHQWKSVGHVPREDMERINNGYRDAIDRFFDVRQGLIKELDAEKEANAVKKEEILGKMEAYRAFEAKKPKEWNEATQSLRTLQDEWKVIGQASYSVNNELWGRYRDLCNTFFTRKAEFFRQFDEVRNANLELKRKLVEKAEALKEGSKLESSAKELKALQQEWKEIGPVPGRYSNKLWNRFRAACDDFFESRREHYQEMHADEHTNLEQKKQLIEAVKALKADEFGEFGEAVEKIKALQAEWKEIGKVPFKQKDTIWDEFRAAIDAFFDQLPKKGAARDSRPRTAGKSRDRDTRRDRNSGRDRNSDRDQGANDGNRDVRDKIFRIRKKLQQAEAKVEQYSTNIQFISRGKSGDKLRDQIQKEIDNEQRTIDQWKAEVDKLEDILNNPAPVAEPEKPAEKVAETPVDAEKGDKTEATTEDAVAETPAPEEVAAPEVEAPVAEEAPETEAETPVAKEEAPELETEAPVAEEPATETPAEEAEAPAEDEEKTA